MAFQTRADLITAVLSWLNREGDTALEAVVPDWIELAEARIRREQNWFRQFFTLANGGTPLAITAHPMQLPVYVRDVISMWNDGSAVNFGNIEVLTPSSWRSYLQSNPAGGSPARKAVIVPQMDAWLTDPDGLGVTVAHGPFLYLYPPPPVDGTMKVDFEFVRDLPPLTVSAVNGLFIRHPDLYLYGTLVESAPYLQHDERLPLWESRFQQAISEINLEREHAMFAASAKRVQLPKHF